MQKLLLVLLLLSACAASGKDGPPLDVSTPDSAIASRDAGSFVALCPASISEICNDKTCLYMGAQYPSTLASWCDDQALDGVPSSTAGDPACGNWTMVSVQDGDQRIELFYDSNGVIAAIQRWGSAPPCEGSCVLTCVAGPSNAALLPDCNATTQLVCGA